MPVFAELAPWQQKQYAKALPPEVRQRIGQDFRTMATGLYRRNLSEIYQGAMDMGISALFGAEAAKSVDWTKPPQIGIPERRYLAVLNKFSRLLQEGDIESASQLLQGTTSVLGHAVQSGGIPCNPEVLILFPSLKELQPLLTEGKIPRKGQTKISEGLSRVVEGFNDGNRRRVYQGLAEIYKESEVALRK